MTFDLSISLSLFAFWLTYVLLMKDCPLAVCVLFRRKLNFKPFSCFFCLSFWIYCVTILLFYIVAFISPLMAKQIGYVLGGIGITSLLYIFLNNFCTREYNNDVDEVIFDAGDSE